MNQGESWDITTSVGSTAAMVAAFRAVEPARPEPIIRDKYARLLVFESGSGWEKLIEPSMTATLASADPEMRVMFDHMRGFHAARTNFFDTFVTDALDARIRQLVILAAGLDSRAYRLTWPEGSVVYEVDQPGVLAYKAGALAAHHVQPTEIRRAVAADLREDWPAALTAAGFDPAAPTAWLTEGLLVYLPADGRALLLDRITDLSKPGSRVAADTVQTHPGEPAAWERFMKRAGELGIDPTVDIDDLVYHDGGGPDAFAALLTERGWRPETRPVESAMRALGCWVDLPRPEDAKVFGAFVSAELR